MGSARLATRQPSARRRRAGARSGSRRPERPAVEAVLRLQATAGNRAATQVLDAVGPDGRLSTAAARALRRVLGTDVPGNRFPDLWAPTAAFFQTFVPSLPTVTGGGRVHASIQWPQSVLPTDSPVGAISELSGHYVERLSDVLDGVPPDRYDQEIRRFAWRAQRAWSFRTGYLADTLAANASLDRPHPTLAHDLAVYRAFEARLITHNRTCVLTWL